MVKYKTCQYGKVETVELSDNSENNDPESPYHVNVAANFRFIRSRHICQWTAATSELALNYYGSMICNAAKLSSVRCCFPACGAY